MTTHTTPSNPSRGGLFRLLAAALVSAVCAMNSFAQAPAAAPQVSAVAPSAEQLEQLVARFALYPDDLVAIILPAATFPTQVVQADRFLDKRKADPNLKVDERWDDSVKSLLNYPVVIKTMSTELDWTTDLGEAFVANQGAVLEAVQAFRRKAQSAGNLKSDTKTVVVVEKEIIKIEPADPQVIYVPQYNPSTVVVYGTPYWGYYPAPYPSYYYPYAAGATFAAGLVWGAAISSAWRGNHYAAHYGGGNNNININRNTNINTGNINRGDINRPTQNNFNRSNVSAGNNMAGDRNRSGAGAGNVGAGNNQWNSNSNRAAQNNGSFSSNPSRGSGYDRGGGGGGYGSQGGGGAFGGGSGQRTSMDSSRGAQSRGSMSSAPRGGGSYGGGGGRGGGGGGGRGGGGGGRR